MDTDTNFLPRRLDARGDYVAPRGSLEFGAFGTLGDALAICARLAVPFVEASPSGTIYAVATGEAVR